MTRHAPDLTPDEHDRLLTRIVDGEATGADWDTFRAVASHDQSVWGELSETQRAGAVLAEGVRARSAIADSVDLPEDFLMDPERSQRRFDAVSRWGGWAAAAAVLLVWFTGGVPSGLSGGGPGSQQAGLIPLSSATPDQALDRYMNAGREQGRVISELPNPVLVSAEPLDDGTVRVTFLRQILERTVVNQVYTTSQNELGEPVTTPARVEQADSGSY
ncbi:MAG: hypothetical protein ACF8Q5_07985 [Phycisphaerales bacterium JB040]